MIVVLMGYMGSGKSTIGKDLAKVLDYRFLDLDEYISEKENATIKDIFDSSGEIYFRKKENHYLNEILNSQENKVLALGGGTPCYGRNLKLLLDNSQVKLFYLKLSIPLLAKRLYNEREKRPLINHISSESELVEFIGKHLFERTYYYNQAQYTIDIDNKSKKETLETILMQLI
ncbi:shikimate kinase [Winogradskyella luteola]|uniref:Shikimate kinase n=1 Tax=Winogradskyella luteola TaxID=2828330 RepID=A0A9X1F799_9FLAO|nr:shikimate kinase [Winogradskyella luteola]MBV7268666.1 shikimate kinase [Winogradskyella luteola]